MNDEIKEIKHSLQLLHAECNPKAREEDINRAMDYITNLQQENERLKEEKQELNDSVTWWNNRFNAVQRDYEDYKSRCEKAVECINGTTFFGLRSCKTFMSKYLNELLNILNGRSGE